MYYEGSPVANLNHGIFASFWISDTVGLSSRMIASQIIEFQITFIVCHGGWSQVVDVVVRSVKHRIPNRNTTIISADILSMMSVFRPPGVSVVISVGRHYDSEILCHSKDKLRANEQDHSFSNRSYSAQRLSFWTSRPNGWSYLARSDTKFKWRRLKSPRICSRDTVRMVL